MARFDLPWIVIDSNINDFNLRAAHDALYPAPTGSESPPISVVAIIEQGVIVGSSSTATPAFTVGEWPEDVPVKVVNAGTILGTGGDGGTCTPPGGSQSERSGKPGGPAFHTRYPVKLEAAKQKRKYRVRRSACWWFRKQGHASGPG